MIIFTTAIALLAPAATVAEWAGALRSGKDPVDTQGKVLHLRESAAIWPRLMSSADPSPSCDCSGCTDEDTVLFGRHKDLLSDVCPEGSVATVTKLRTVDDRAHYDLVVKNKRDGITDGSDYVYRQVRETSCHEVPPEDLPVVGDQDRIEVTLNCEAFKCDFRWDVEFGCQELGILTTTAEAGGGVQVLSDVDDTVVCADPPLECDSAKNCIHKVEASLAGADRRLESKERYPGAAELYLGLALGPGGGNDGQYVPAKPMMLSARPKEAQLFMGIDQSSELNVYMESVGWRWNFPTWGVNTDGSMYGTIFDGTSFTEFGQTKAKSYNSLSDSLPNTRFAFVGDNGQGDPCGAQSMLESSNGERMEAVLIHEVVDPGDVHTRCEQPQGGVFTLDLPESDRVHYFRTHSNAAVWALQKNLISCCSASAVHYAVNEFVQCRCGNNVCPAGGLNTGVAETATRSETLAYCREIEADQESLSEAIDACDVDGSCPSPSEVSSKSLANVLFPKGKWNKVIMALTYFFL